jgi:hypothetical protein
VFCIKLSLKKHWYILRGSVKISPELGATSEKGYPLKWKVVKVSDE